MLSIMPHIGPSPSDFSVSTFPTLRNVFATGYLPCFVPKFNSYVYISLVLSIDELEVLHNARITETTKHGIKYVENNHLNLKLLLKKISISLKN